MRMPTLPSAHRPNKGQSRRVSLRNMFHNFVVPIEEQKFKKSLLTITNDLKSYPKKIYLCPIGYNEFDFFLENKEYRPFDGCKIEI
jgi:hypothetical protein